MGLGKDFGRYGIKQQFQAVSGNKCRTIYLLCDTYCDFTTFSRLIKGGGGGKVANSQENFGYPSRTNQKIPHSCLFRPTPVLFPYATLERTNCPQSIPKRLLAWKKKQSQPSCIRRQEGHAYEHLSELQKRVSQPFSDKKREKWCHRVHLMQNML